MNALHKVITVLGQLCVISNCFVIVTAQSWSYEEQENWPGYCNNGSSQSPINIPKYVIPKRRLLPLNFQNWDKAVETNVTNDGHTVLVKIPGNVKPTLSGGCLNGTFNFDNFHFHWPAEHTVAGRSFALEAHFVFYSNRFEDLDSAINDRNGVAVVGIFFDTTEGNSSVIFNILASAAQNVSKEVGSHTKTEPIAPGELLPSDPRLFYFYKGSLTTPNCNEVVSWYILKLVGKINIEKYKLLTTIYGSNNQLLNFTNRKIQLLNGRLVYKKWFSYE